VRRNAGGGWRVLLVLVALGSWGTDVSAQTTPGAQTATATRITTPLTIDGRLNEPGWQTAAPLGNFTQREPFEGRPASEETEVRLLFDDDALYVGAWMWDRDTSAMVLGETRRDANLRDTDAFRILLDTYFDRQNGFVFGTTPAGIEYDGQVTREGEGGFSGQQRSQSGSGGGFNLNWDGTWEVATSRDGRGWYAEFRIPFRTLRYRREGAQQWGLNFARSIRRTNEEALWSPVPRQFEFYRVSLAGVLAGIEAPAQRPFTITPYVLTSVRKDYLAATSSDFDGDIGGDAKIARRSGRAPSACPTAAPSARRSRPRSRR
jgi:hypothetical protein